ncbi:MAG: family 78 glycoside hydrolase catalytic domain, partial [Chloroflexi bacterium]|nr:family 78 glycoside hydrolase catalytic domain [Chloroflexota bacterium]
SDQSIQVEYAGQPLQSRTRCHWKVRGWDKDDKPSPWSAPASWTMGLLNPGDWQGQWIGATDRRILPRSDSVMGYHAAEAKDPLEVKWVQVDLGAPRPITRVTLYPAAPPGFSHVQGFGFPVRFRIEVSDDPDFKTARALADFSRADYPNPGNESRAFPAQDATRRFVRVTVTKLWNRGTGTAPLCFALSELEVFSGEENVALHAQVTAKDNAGVAGWENRLLTDGIKLAADEDAAARQRAHAALLLRKELAVGKPLKRATAFICGLGYCELYVNGRKVGDQVLDPGFTDFTKRALYLTYDVTHLLKTGANALGVILGGGWYHLATPDLFGFERAPWTAPPKLLFHLALEFNDGTTQTLVSDGSWKWSTGPVTFNCIRGGETIDAREEKPGWNLAGCDDSAWKTVAIVKPPAGKLVAQQHPPIRVRQIIMPVKLTEPQPGVYVFDLGVNIAGWARLQTSGPRGQKITLHYNERLNPDGTVDVKHCSSHTHGRFQTEEFILKGGGVEVFEPRFTYHGFRYVQVTGLAEKPTAESLRGCWVTTDPAPAGAFACSNPRINQLREVILRTYLNNLHGLPTDCPQREKMGWLNDGCVGMEMAFHNYDTALIYTKWFHDMMDAQEANGHVADFVPTCGWGKSKANGAPGEMADPWWGGAIVLAPWKLYQHYGDTRVLAEGYPAMRAYVDYLTSTAKAHFIEWGLGDWLDESAGGGGRRVPVVQTSTAAYFYYATILSQTAALLGQQEDAKKYGELAATIRDAFNRRFLDLVTGLYAKDSQTAQALPLYLSLAPEDQRPLILTQLVNSSTGSRKNHISSGIIGTLYVFHALTQNGRDDLAYAMATQEYYPGWLHMLNQGATAIWEAWNGEASHNHPTLGCMDVWFYQGLAGIRPDPAALGFKEIIIQPAVVGDLTWINAHHDSPYGRIVSHWTRDGERLTMAVTIPANSAATVHVPAKDANVVKEGGQPAAQAEGVKFLRAESAAAVFRVGSGNYRFQSTLPDAIAQTRKEESR